MCPMLDQMAIISLHSFRSSIILPSLRRRPLAGQLQLHLPLPLLNHQRPNLPLLVAPPASREPRLLQLLKRPFLALPSPATSRPGVSAQPATTKRVEFQLPQLPVVAHHPLKGIKTYQWAQLSVVLLVEFSLGLRWFFRYIGFVKERRNLVPLMESPMNSPQKYPTTEPN